MYPLLIATDGFIPFRSPLSIWTDGFLYFSGVAPVGKAVYVFEYIK